MQQVEQMDSFTAPTYLDDEEQRVLSYLTEEKPELTLLFRQYIGRARGAILHRLFQAVIREQLIAPRHQRIEPSSGSIEVQLPGGKAIRATIGKKHAFGRYDLEGGLFLWDGNEEMSIAHPVDLLDLLVREGAFGACGDARQHERFRLELQNSVANYALALAGRHRIAAEMAARSGAAPCGTSLQWAQWKRDEDERFSPLVFFEQLVVDGHPLHPGAKIKMGLDAGDVIAYSPEWNACPDVALAAVALHACRFVSLNGDTPKEILYREHPGLREHVADRLRKLNLDESRYELIPVHPWQFEHTLPKLHADAIRNQEIVMIPDYRIKTAALMSFRSLAPLQKRQEGKHHIKTAINVQTTGAVRTVSPHSAENGPVLSRILNEILVRENHFGGTFIVLEERAAVYYNAPDPALPDKERWTLGANLASILRENPENHVGPDEMAMPGSALLAPSPFSGKPVAGELIMQFAGKRHIADPEEAAAAFVRRYAETALPGFLTVAARYGISLEGHLQNSVPVFRGGEPVRMIIRDFGGVRIYRDRLKKQGLDAQFHKGSATVTEDVGQMRNIISYSVVQNHFGELISCIVRALEIGEGPLWQEVADVCRHVMEGLKNDPDIREQAYEDERELFKPTIQLKAMVKMRLLGDITEYSFTDVPNPLALAGRGNE